MPNNFQDTYEEPSDREDNEDEDESNSVNVSPSVHAASELVSVRVPQPSTLQAINYSIAIRG
jgi:hypothetical protein